MVEPHKIGWNLENSYAKLPSLFYTETSPTHVRAPELVIFNKELATSLGLNTLELQGENGVPVFAGNKIPEGGLPLSQAYAGHQFGHFTMLGDGRAVLIGEQMTPQGERFDIQLKGAGETPYSRGGDGRAALGPMLREYIISEAMHGLRIPTSRSLAVVTTGESIIRETELPGAILTRVAASHLRVGTFQYVSKWGTEADLKVLADYTIKRHFPGIEADGNKYLSLLKVVINRQAEVIAKWQLVGFIHGVMNTDNMTISGETIDYGPCAFMDTYDPSTVFSSIDVQGRYAYGNQPSIASWNLARFAETLLPLLHGDEDKAVEVAQEEITNFTKLYQDYWLSGMRAKLGIFNKEVEDGTLVNDLLEMMKKWGADYTNTFRALTLHTFDEIDLLKSAEFMKWHQTWQSRLDRQQESNDSSLELMHGHNPAIIPRNHRVEEALEAAVEQGDYRVMKELLRALRNPYAYRVEQADYIAPSRSKVPYQTFCGT
ncbi:MAG TPA: YdiU family protein [Candidatus Dormibacteraeota bacterium]|nr:YdiU family protein [Candidatus Dormibacteraeota bacterium]